MPLKPKTGASVLVNKKDKILLIKVGTIELSEAVADPIPGSFIGEIDIREGDELIVPPAF